MSANDPNTDPDIAKLITMLIEAIAKASGYNPKPLLDLPENPTLAEVVDALYTMRRSMSDKDGNLARKAHPVIGDHLLDWTFQGVHDGTPEQVQSETDGMAVLYAINELTSLPEFVQVWGGEVAARKVHGPEAAKHLSAGACIAFWQQTLCTTFYMRGYQSGRKAEREIDLLNRTMGGMR